MKQSNNNNRMQAGFTLVEVIVVAVIVAAMAAVAIPMYLGYIESTRRNAAANAAGSIASFCGACLNGGGALPGAGAVAGTLTCTNPAANNPTILIPADIVVNLVAAPRGVTARHAQSDVSVAANTISYNY